jgi:putative phosphoesterase
MRYESIAVLSDIHCNSWALEAVIEDVEKRGITTVVNLGDSFYGPLDPSGTADLLIPLNAITVRGNEDRILIEDGESSSSVTYVRERLTSDHIDFIRKLNATESIDGDLFLFHGTPDSDREYLLHEVSPDGLHPRREKGIQQLLKDRPESLFLCGHDHLPNVVNLAGNKLVVNPGSVGLPAYNDDAPYRHRVENESPHARYCVIEKASAGWSVEQISITYNHDAASEMAKKNNRDDWAFWLKTGRAK